MPFTDTSGMTVPFSGCCAVLFPACLPPPTSGGYLACLARNEVVASNPLLNPTPLPANSLATGVSLACIKGASADQGESQDARLRLLTKPPGNTHLR